MSDADATLTIGEVARRAGLRTSAIRYYESVGVLPPAERRAGQRRYGPEAVERLRALEVAKRAGFSPAEARALLEAPRGERLRELARRKLPEVEALICEAQAKRDWLTLASDCECETLDACTLFAR